MSKRLLTCFLLAVAQTTAQPIRAQMTDFSPDVNQSNPAQPHNSGPLHSLHPSSAPSGLKVGELHPRGHAVFFAIDPKAGPDMSAPGQTAATYKLAYLAPEEMSADDHALAVDAEAAIAERAVRFGFDLHAGDWRYEQAVCPAFPRHIVLQFYRYGPEGDHDATVFSAVVPRLNVDDHVRILPVERHGYSLFSPTPVNKIALNDFNHIVAAEDYQAAPDWLTLGLCYAAIAGGRPQASLAPMTKAEEHYPLVRPAMESEFPDGSARIVFADLTAERPVHQPWTAKAEYANLPIDWTLHFNPKGYLVKVERKSTTVNTFHNVKAGPQEGKFFPVKTVEVDGVK